MIFGFSSVGWGRSWNLGFMWIFFISSHFLCSGAGSYHTLPEPFLSSQSQFIPFRSRSHGSGAGSCRSRAGLFRSRAVIVSLEPVQSVPKSFLLSQSRFIPFRSRFYRSGAVIIGPEPVYVVPKQVYFVPELEKSVEIHI